MLEAARTEDYPEPGLEGYRRWRPLGRGGNGRLWLAERQEDGRRFAVKEVDLFPRSRPKEVELFTRECDALQALTHDQIPRFVGVHVLEETPERMTACLVQEFIDGPSLQILLERGLRLSAADTVAALRGALAPLAYLHSRKPPLFHRDIKPANLLLRSDGSLVLVDFGAVRRASGDDNEMGSSVVGTFGFMAPEQLQGRVTRSSDLYALGATGVYLLTGMEPLRFELDRLRPRIRPFLACDERLADLLERFLEPAPEDRFPDAAAADSALLEWQIVNDRIRTTLSPALFQDDAGHAGSQRTRLTDARSRDTTVGGPARGVEVDPSLWEGGPDTERSAASAQALREDGAPETPAASTPTVPAAATEEATTMAAALPSAESPQAAAPLIRKRGHWWSTVRPGGPWRLEIGVLLLAPGILGILLGLSGMLQYDAALARTVGLIFIGLSLVWFLWPPRRVARGRAAAMRYPQRTDVTLVSVIRETLPMAGSRWWAELEYETEEELVFRVRCPLTGPREAKALLRRQVEPLLRVHPTRPTQAQVYVRAAAPKRGQDG